jgi:site-specific DNA-cytosine methylase
MPRNHAEDGLVTFYSTSGEQDRPSPDVANSLKAVSVMCVTSPDIAPRRLTPVECERLMSWPDDWTRYRADGKEQADSHRYKQCGNGVVSNVAEWIGRRIMQAQQETTT